MYWSLLPRANKGAEISVQLLVDNGIIGKNDKIKVLGRGELKSKVNVQAHAFSDTAVKAIEKVGGTATTIK
jgi:large subunit ribosomal protein L15